MFSNIYSGKKVFVTGMTGFKGSWLTTWLRRLGADVIGYSLASNTDPSHFELLAPDVKHVTGDIRDFAKLFEALRTSRAELVFHLAAQPLVRESYISPVETFNTNIMGTVNLLEACRQTDTVKAVVVVSSDKCYRNNEQHEGYREEDPLGGHDPYSASKACTDIVTGSYRDSFMHNIAILVASARAGNVIGGGDWAADRLIPDLMRAFAGRQEAVIRNPNAVRPWQHVLEPLSGYLLLGQKLLEGDGICAAAWNFGPSEEDVMTVKEVIDTAGDFFTGVKCRYLTEHNEPHEAGLLKLNCSKALKKLRWSGVWDSRTAVRRTVEWYMNYYEKDRLTTNEDLERYIDDAKRLNKIWVK